VLASSGLCLLRSGAARLIRTSSRRRKEKNGGKRNVDSAVARCSPRFPAGRVTHPTFSNRNIPRLDLLLSYCKHTKATRSNRNRTRLLKNHFSGCSASALSLRLGFTRLPVEASATAVLDCGFHRVIAYPPGGGAVTLIQTQRANSYFEVSRHEMPVPTIASRPRSEFRLSAFVPGSVGARHAVPTRFHASPR
jgi:hypothetical protein